MIGATRIPGPLRSPLVWVAPLCLVNSLILGGGISPVEAAPSAASTAACPYLEQSSDRDTTSTQSVYDSNAKALNIQVQRSVPEMFWPIAESRTRARVSKILDNCPTINTVYVTFVSGQRLTVRRADRK